jgi:hypothetical protein
VTTRKSSNDPTAEQLPADQPVAGQLPADQDDDLEINNDLPDTEPIDESPADEKGERGRSEEARANAPGQQKKREDPNTYPDPDNPPHTP